MSKQINVSKLVKRPVPAGHKIKYRHIYETQDGRPLMLTDVGVWVSGTDVYTGPRRLSGTCAWLETTDGVIAAQAYAMCNPKDTPIKKLGVTIAHNRCIKQFESLSHAHNG